MAGSDDRSLLEAAGVQNPNVDVVIGGPAFCPQVAEPWGGFVPQEAAGF